MAQLRKALRLSGFFFLLAVVPSLYAASQAQVQPKAGPLFLAEHYDVSATLDAGGQSIFATAKVQFRATSASGIVRFELHPNLNISDVKSEQGTSLKFERESTGPMDVRVQLPSAVATNSKVTLTISYTGILSNEENSPLPGVRLASIYKDGAYLLLPARWFPLTGYPTNRFTGTFRLNVPDTFAMAGTGKALAPTPISGKTPAEGSRLQYVFECTRPAPNGTFVAGNLELNTKQAEGVNVAVYAPKTASATVGDFAADVARGVITFSDLFGPIPDPNMTLIQIPDNTLREYAGPGVLLLSQRAWDAKINERTIARLVASQWWANQVLPASTADEWISDGLARYSESLYAEQTTGKEAGLKAVDDFAVGALMYDDAAPVSQSARLVQYSSDYRSVVMNKGAMIFHMLRAQIGDAAFKALLHDFYTRYAERNASIADFTALAEQHGNKPLKPGQSPPNLRGFFAQWLNSTGIPDFKIEYVIYRTPKGFRIVGKLSQPLDTFAMPVDLRIDTEGNPEIKTVEVTGTETPFSVETFGRPKPGGVRVDPNNVILKGNNSLRSRAAIARGEELAETGHYYDAIKEYQKALSIQPGRPLANFRMGEAFFYQRNYQAAANAFREALQAVPEPSEKWTEVWGHVYLGMIFDSLGQRERAVNEYSRAKQTNDNTGSAQDAADRYLKKPYSDNPQPADPGGAKPGNEPKPAEQPADDRPKLKKPQ
ncbi:MAG TPA: M1 family aminopeptidase [Candidatus Dormibacteraeota bacterium]|nr:M1 family aminopeptidase [Candidatus Dormibacteraeota bacterium]